MTHRFTTTLFIQLYVKTGVTSGAGTDNHSGAPEFTPGF